MIVLLDTEFTRFDQPELLSIGMVTSAEPAIEFYAEIDLQSAEGLRRKRRSSEMVVDEVLVQWGVVVDAAGTPWEMGRRAGEWLIAMHEIHLATDPHQHARLEVAFDHTTDFELLEEAIRDAGIWDQVRDITLPVNIERLVGTIEAELAADECFAQLRRRKLRRHHALADALAMRAGYLAAKQSVVGRAGAA